MGSRVIVVVDRDPRPPQRVGGVHAQHMGGVRRVSLTEDGRRSPPRDAVGGYVETGVERSGANEPVRSLHEAVKPKLHYAYDRCASVHLRASAWSETHTAPRPGYNLHPRHTGRAARRLPRLLPTSAWGHSGGATESCG